MTGIKRFSRWKQMRTLLANSERVMVKAALRRAILEQASKRTDNVPPVVSAPWPKETIN